MFIMMYSGLKVIWKESFFPLNIILEGRGQKLGPFVFKESLKSYLFTYIWNSIFINYKVQYYLYTTKKLNMICIKCMICFSCGRC